ncbi:GGDEF domain-containing protein [Bacteriovoracaceae bacterium]|nr:GGDEF domain-containing protein [Bacteriovoracaceae bacterium]
MCLNFTSNIKDKFSSFVNAIGEDLRIHFFPFSKIHEYKYEDLSLIVLNETDGINETQLMIEFIKNNFKDTAISIVINHKSYDMAMLAYRFNLCDVLDDKFGKAELMRMFLRAKIFSEIDKKEDQIHVPYFRLLNILSMPSNIKTSDQLVRVIVDYCSNFTSVDDFIVLKNTGDNYHVKFSLKKDLSSINFELVRDHLKDRRIGMQGKVYTDEQSKNRWSYLILDRDDFEGKEGLQNQLILLIKMDDEEEKIFLNDFLVTFLQNVSHFKGQLIKLDKLESLALTDEVSGLYNQRKLMMDLSTQIKLHEDGKKHFCVLFIDIDRFKLVNDNHGHLAGSDLICQLGTLVRKYVRSTDQIYRFGGDEFVIIMPNVTQKKVYPIALRLLEKIKNHSFLINDRDEYKMSTSIGICEYPTNATTDEEIIQFADDMMYKSKKAGRGKVFHIKEVS